MTLSELERAVCPRGTSDMCAQQGTALLHTEIFSHVWEMELSVCLSGSYISLVSTEKRQNRWEKEIK